MTDISKQLIEAKQVIRSILLSSQNGLTVRQLCLDYKKLNGKDFPYREFGYVTPKDLLKSMPDVVKLEWLHSVQDFILKGIADETTRHIDNLVKKSKKSKKNSHIPNIPRLKNNHKNHSLRHEPKTFVPANLRNQIRELLTCYKDGLLLNNFDLAFYKRFGINLNFFLLGFYTLEELLTSIPEIVKIEGNSNKRIFLAFNTKSNEKVLSNDDRVKKFNESQMNNQCNSSELNENQVSNHCISSGLNEKQSNSRRNSSTLNDKVNDSSSKQFLNIPSNKEKMQERHSKQLENSETSPYKLKNEEDKHERHTNDLETSGMALNKHITERKHRRESRMNELESFEDLLCDRVKNVSFQYEENNANRCSDNIKEEFRKILSFFPDGIWATDFMKEYAKITRKELHIMEMGFSSLMELISSFSDVFFTHRPNLCKDNWLLFDINNPKTKSFKQEIKTNSNASLFNTLKIDDEPPIDDFIKANILSILNMVKEEISLTDFEKLYKATCQVELPWANLGYDSIESFMVVLSDDIPLKLSTKGGKVFISSSVEETCGTINLMKFDDINEIPQDVVLSGTSFTVQQLPQDISRYIGVYISTVDNPGQIWFQIRGKTTTEALEVLMEKLDVFYNGNEGKKYKMPDTSIEIDNICAALWTDDNWHRGIITGIPSKEAVDILYVDYGTKGTIPKGYLRFLKKEFMILPSQAIKGRLSNIKPSNGRRWCDKSKHVLIDLCSDKPLVALITNTKYKERVSLCLCDVSNNEDLHINDTLIKEGLAVLTTDPSENENLLFDQEYTPSTPLILQNAETQQEIMKNYLSLQHLQQLAALDVKANVQAYLNSISDYNPLSHQKNTSYPESGINHSPAYFLETQSDKLHTSTADVCVSSSFEKDKNTNANVGEIFEEGEEFYDKLCEASEELDFTITKISLAENYRIHIINCNRKPYVCSGDIESLFKTSICLEKLLLAKKTFIPHIIFDKLQYKNLFKELKRYNIKGINETSSTLTLYPLEYIPEILLCLKHPSEEIKKNIKIEIIYFYFINNLTTLTKEQIKEIHLYECQKRQSIIQKMFEDGNQVEYVEEVRRIEEGLQLLRLRIKEQELEAEQNLNDSRNPSQMFSEFTPTKQYCDKEFINVQKFSPNFFKNLFQDDIQKQNTCTNMSTELKSQRSFETNNNENPAYCYVNSYQKNIYKNSDIPVLNSELSTPLGTVPQIVTTGCSNNFTLKNISPQQEEKNDIDGICSFKPAVRFPVNPLVQSESELHALSPKTFVPPHLLLRFPMINNGKT